MVPAGIGNCDMTALAIPVVMNNLAHHSQTEERGNGAGRAVIIGRGGRGGKCRRGNRDGGKGSNKAGGECEFHKSDPFGGVERHADDVLRYGINLVQRLSDRQ